MDFNIKKPSHIFALMLVIISFSVFIVLPALSYFGIPSSAHIASPGESIKSSGVLFELIILLFQITIAIGLFIIVPFLWYFIVNRFTLKEIFSHLKLWMMGIDLAFLWGVLSAIAALGIIAVIGVLLAFLGFDLTNSSNIPELELYFSIPSMLVLITFQPIAEEIFFRGFLLEKIDSLIGEKTAIITTAMLFGFAHLSFGNVYPALMTGTIGILLAYLVIKTKNLYSSITAHIIFNLISFSVFMFSKSIH